jgi:large subunit ribosomal protein L6
MITVPQGVQISVEKCIVSVKGPKGEDSRDFCNSGAKIERTSEGIHVSAEKKMANTIEAHIRNMIKGVSEGYGFKMKMLYSHFPMALEVKGGELVIKNFIGEKQPRRVKIVGKTKIEVKGQELTISGSNKEHVGQTVANIKTATKILRRDSRVFQDGIYITE